MTLYPCSVSAQLHAITEQVNNQGNTGYAGGLGKLPILAASTMAVTKSGSPEERLSQLLKQIQDDVKATTPVTNTSAKPGVLALMATANSNTALLNQRVSSIRNANSQIKAIYNDIDQSFKDTEQHLKDAKLPSEILARHRKAVSDYQSRQTEFNKIMDRVVLADDKGQTGDRQTALTDLSGFMDKYPNAKPHQYTDPNKLPFGSPSNKVRKPNESKAQYQASLFPPKYDKVMLAGKMPDGLQLAQATLPALPTAQDTAETEEVQLTPAIKAQAAALNNNPVQIYNWVRNNISFIPSYGSIQGSELTLQNKRGNAFDTASLLIALYRSAGIPARYVYGTIDVPADKVMNWVGGVTKIEAAQSLLGQGGIPNTGLINGGQISTIRMEHVWVEAFVDYTPSRGAINKNPNTWVPMDASFKQYEFTAGMDIKNKVPANSQDFLAQMLQGATVNEAGGYVQNLSQVNLPTQINNYQTQVQNYVKSQKANATVGDVLGIQKIKVEAYGILLGSLPYRVVATGSEFQTLPDNLRWKFRTNLYLADGINTADNPILELNRGTPQLASKKITLSFAPATQADQELINSYMPKAHADGTPLQANELPPSLPGYLLNMKAEFRVDGQVIATSAGSFTMGSSIKQQNQYFNPGTGAWEGGDDNDITVGEYDAIGLDLQGMGTQQLKALQDRMTTTKAKLAQFQLNPGDLTKEDITGDLMLTGILSYFVQVDSSDNWIALTAGNVVNYRLPSYGRFLTAAQPHFFFGIVRTVSFPGVMMDVDYVRGHAETKDGDQSKHAAYIRQAGSIGSAAEHAVPEAMLQNTSLAANDPSQPQGVSAVKALAIAAAQGQKIYTLNQSNQGIHSAVLQSLQISTDVKLEVANALSAGKEVTVHEKDIAANGWVGNGYIILDQDTGAGAYKIAGGSNGGILIATGVTILAIAALALTVLMEMGPPGLALFTVFLQLGSALIAAGVALLTGYTAICAASMSIAFAAIWELAAIAEPYSFLFANTIGGTLWSTITGGGSLSICGVP
ncbi:transglutaminase-like domain-containing protein [Undibacterium sp. TS12]|uniref:transglutaminase-like domain-containing protein n=1 Tax=Undibacterium sp. TS12 TaxID=2908202 RepID=UPI001F4CB6CD|nr:transglutaminase-like domain-containing protein [Undibacterium sp. TS12]MCH8618028.1 transglutaminase-like domain-containing protein [Undibacterium sp. TS12]